MTIETKFNIGDTVFTIDNKTSKIKEFEIEKIFVVKSENYTQVNYKEVGASLLDPDYKEDKCFATKEELIDFISQ